LENEISALPTDGNVAAGEPAAPATELQSEQVEQASGEATGTENSEASDSSEKPEKKEKTPEQREIDRLRRRVDNLTKKKYELEALRQEPQRQQDSDDESLTVSRAELDRMIAERAEKLAPTIKEQQAEIEHRQEVIKTLSKEWGQEKFDAIAAELDDALGGLLDARGRPKPATEAIFEAEDHKSVIEFLTDPENSDVAERLARSSAVRAGLEIARIEAKLKEQKAKAKAKPSNAARPLESVKGGGVPTGIPDPADTKAYIKWANEQERSRR
jgi:hypothetical protein